MFIMVHDLELSVGGQVHLGETWALTTGLQRCGEDRVIVGTSVAKTDLLNIDQIVTSHLVDRPRAST